MRNFLNKLSYYFRESYGIDKLSTHLYIGGIVLSLFRRTATLGFVFFIYSTWRCLSRNKYRRYKELEAYENFISPLAKRFSGFTYSMNNHKQYKIFKCPNCSQKLRVPRHKGKITITCKNCGTSFKRKS
ncbi:MULTISPECIES: zinc finger containing protein [Clostridium]|uniref:Predicted zinc finger containing protein n=4 Tax=Clostridium TaxID=1485 RepID=D8GPP9_CLOLD|nr:MULTISPECIES: zinc finger containing protein [Clostridium]ADK13958.1 predicted zinc finger containing protein [Clostridium ljungdahlii DSM 13528]AGY77188.1 hypothetical protein CAETHG_2985 [Clostridium autoethanogenum DSM 10061]ALU37331.1 Hypothetical protein CLAU_2904 [Clostridium autoethanogenum DSM 10061]OAA87450.1 hypothetical protein WX45_03570 [Clostridium ljungdahlii DSM 13528]OAA93587.1 hypothetical protein WX73_04083 [Clostridium coskatii]